MLHGYKKSRYNIYDNLEFLGLNPYEQKHFCFGEGGGEGGGSADDYEETTGFKDEDLDPSVDPDDPTSLSTDPAGLTAQEAEEAFAVADATGLAIGSQAYQDVLDTAVDLDAVQKQDMVFDLNLARDIAGKYGLEPTQVTPAFMDPTGVQTIGYRGPGSTKAAATEIGRGAATLAANLVEMYPGPLNMLSTIAKEEFDVKMPSLNLTDKLTGYFDSLAASQREANIAARGETDPSTAGIIDDVEEEDSEKGAFSSFAPPTISEQIAAAPPEQVPSSVDYYDGNEIISRIIPQTSTATPVVEEEVDIAAATPRTRTASTSNLDILRRIYGNEIAGDLTPPRTDLSRIV